MKYKTLAMALLAVAAVPALAEVISVADSSSLFMDTRSGTRYVSSTNVVHDISWNAAWIGENSAAEVVIADNGTEVKRATGSGVFAWSPSDYSDHVLTYATYIGGIAQDEVYTNIVKAIDCEGMGIAGLQRVTFRGSAYDASNVAMGAEPIVTLDCDGMYDAGIGSYTTYAYHGYMFFFAGETYTFRGYFDDYASVMVDGKSVVAKGSSQCQDASGTISFDTDGWRKVEFRVSNNTGTGGPMSDVGIMCKRSSDDLWRKIADDGSGTLLRTGPDYCGVEIISARMRPSDPTIMDVVYKVTSPKSVVKVRALAYEDGNRSFANAVPVLTFADGTETSVGDNVTPNEEHVISWQVAADWATDLTKVRFEVMVMDDMLLPIHLITIPRTASHAAVQYSDTVVSSTAVMNALLWLYASQDDDLNLVNGTLSNQYFDLANGTTIKNEAMTVGYLYQKMGYSVLSGKNLEYVNAAARLSLSPSGLRQYALKTIVE